MFLYLLTGFIIGAVGTALLECIKELLEALTEWGRSIIGVKISKNNILIDKMVNEKDSKVHAIGFTIPDEEEEDEIEYV